MDTVQLTEYLIWFTITSLSLYDVWVVVEPTKVDSISERMRHNAQWHLWLPLGFGVLLGHFFGPPLAMPWWTPLPLAGLGLVLYGMGYFRIVRVGWRAMFSLALVGVALGALLWPQPDPAILTAVSP